MKTTFVSAILAMALVPCVATAQAPERPERPDRPERSERADRSNRPERPAERPNRPERPELPERPERPVRPERPSFDAMWKSHDTDGDGFLSREEFNAMPRVSRLPEEQQARLFERLDKDNDGKLSMEEMRMMRQPRDAGRPNPGLRQLMELDTDNSGGVSLEELRKGEMFSRMPAERLEALFRRLDTDGDGEITPRDRPELPRGLRQPPAGPRQDRPERPDPRPEERRERPERPDPRPDRAERPARPEPPNPRVIFQRLDSNSDGALSFFEFRKAPGVAALDEDAQEALFLRLDKDGDHQLTPAEFAAVPMERLLAPQPARGNPDARRGEGPRRDATPRPERRPQPQRPEGERPTR